MTDVVDGTVVIGVDDVDVVPTPGKVSEVVNVGLVCDGDGCDGMIEELPEDGNETFCSTTLAGVSVRADGTLLASTPGMPPLDDADPGRPGLPEARICAGSGETKNELKRA